MRSDQEACARRCLAAAEEDAMTFPQIVATLTEAGFESYAVDFRRGQAIYYLPSGESVALATQAGHGGVAAQFDLRALQAAITEAQTLAPGYSYAGFCRKAAAAGCAGYVVSFSGRRAVYLARTAELHVELFPPAE